MKGLNGFSIDQQIGESDVLSVYRGSNNSTQQAVIIRRFDRKYLLQQQFQFLSKEYENVFETPVSGIDYVLATESHEDDYFIVSEDEGFQPLRTLAQHRQFTISEILQLAIAVAGILATLHKSNLIHKNINTDTILVNPDNLLVKLSGLGFSSKMVREILDITSPSRIKGNIKYISPEQTGRIHRPVDYRSDFYSLGVVLYELSTGTLPCRSDDVLEVIYSHVAGAIDRPDILNPNMPALLGDIIVKLMSKSAGNRYQNAISIRDDFINCADQLRSTGFIANFTLDRRNIGNGLLMSEKLYGLDASLEILQSSFTKVADGERATVFISGSSGTGKTTMVRELKQYFVEHEAIFLQGKFERSSNTQPYYAFIEVIGQFAKYLKAGDQDRLQEWKDKLTLSLGENLKIISGLSAEFHELFDLENPLRSFAEVDSKTRFDHTLVDFISMIASKEHPLVLVIDDLQWADAPSIELFNNLLSAENLAFILIIACYREEEIEQNRVLTKLLTKNLLPSNKAVQIKLENLNKAEVSEFLEDVLYQNFEQTADLGSKLHEQTGGNPFYLKQLMKNLDNNDFFKLDEISQAWLWNETDSINESANVVDLIVVQLSQLNAELESILQHAAVMGYRFVLADLALLIDQDISDLMAKISTLIEADLIVYHTDFCHFSHDRVQQTLIEGLPEAELSLIHWKIGHSLLTHLNNDQVQDRIYEISSHLNLGCKTVDLNQFRQILIELNLDASQKALGENAYLIAKKHADQCILYFPGNIWSLDRNTAFRCYFLQARAEYLAGKIDEASDHVLELVSQLQGYDESVKCFSLLKDIYTNSGKSYEQIIEAALSILQKNGIEISLKNEDLEALIAQEHEYIDSYFKENAMDSILSLPRLNNPKARFCIRFFMELWEGAYYSGRVELMQFCVAKMLSQSLQYGNIDESSFAYVIYASTLSSQGEYQKAYEIGRLGLLLNQQLKNKTLLPKINNLFANYSAFHVRPFSESVLLYQESLTVARTTGDYLFGVWAALFYIWSLLLSGTRLDIVLSESNKHLTFVKATHDKKILYAYQMLQTFIEHYQSESGQHNDRAKFQEYITCWKSENFIPGLPWYAILEAQKKYDDGLFDEAIDLIEKYASNISTEIVMFPISQLYLFYGLSLVARAKCKVGKINNDELDKINNCLKVIRRWSDAGKENFLYQRHLLEAVLEHLLTSGQAQASFDLAISAAELSSSSYNIALCYEHRAYYFRDMQKEPEFFGDLDKAINEYDNWGSTRKYHQLILLRNPSSIGDISYYKKENKNLDFSSLALVEATQAISSETVTEKLYEKMLSILIKNTYAQRGVIITFENNQYLIRVIGEHEEIRVCDEDDILLENYENIPTQIVMDVISSNSDIVLDNALTNLHYADNDYIQRKKVKSILCSPIFYQGSISAIIYLENNISSHIFDSQKLLFIKNFNVQVAISIENSRLYTDLNKQIEETRQVENALRISEERMLRSQEYSRVGTWEWDILTDALYWSDMAKQIVGYDSSKIVEDISFFEAVIHPDDFDMVQVAINKCMYGADYNIEHRVILPDGSIKWVAERGDVQRDEDGVAIKMLGLVLDIDVSKKAEQEKLALKKQLQQAQKMESIGQLTGGIAHDFNNMLASILGYTELALGNELVTGNQRLNKYLNQIQKGGERARDLVAQMLTFSREQNSGLQATNINDALIESTKMLHSVLPTSMKLKIVSSLDAQKIALSSVQLHQIVLNLCINAKDAMDGIGEINILLQTVDQAALRCDSCHNEFSGEFIRLTISDSGPGIELMLLERIFEPFFTTKEVGKGTGMGLSMVHGIMHGAGGHIKVNSAAGKGTEFALFFPLNKMLESEITVEGIEGIEGIEAQRRSINEKILVIDDEAAIALYLKELLTDAGYDVVAVSDSEKGLNLLKKNPKEFDMIVTDQTMPGYTGLEVAHKAIELNAEQKIILTTGYHENVNETSAINAGCSAFLQKPYESSTLLNLLDDLLR